MKLVFSKIECCAIARLLCVAICLNYSIQSAFPESRGISSSYRERARYHFLQDQLSPAHEEEMTLQQRHLAKVLHSGFSMVISAICTQILMSILWNLPLIKTELAMLEYTYQTANTCRSFIGYTVFDDDNIEERVESFLSGEGTTSRKRPYDNQKWQSNMTITELDSWITNLVGLQKRATTLYGKVWLIVFSILSPFVYQKTATKHGFWSESWTYHDLLEKFISQWQEYKICVPRSFHEQFELLYMLYVARNKKLELDENTSGYIVKSIIMQCLEKPSELYRSIIMY